MKICLIRPPQVMKVLSTLMKSSQPLGLAYIAGALRGAGHDVVVIDAIAECPNQINPFKDDLVTIGLNIKEIIQLIPEDSAVIGFSCMFSMNWMNDRVLIDEVGACFPNACLIAGGEHITAAAEFSLSKTTRLKICVLGEGEETIVETINALQNNKNLIEIEGIVFKHNDTITRTLPRKRINNIDSIPWPAWDLFPMDKYYEHSMVYGVDRGKSVPIMASRGCPFSCTFCSSPDMWGTTYNMRSPEDVANEIEFMQHKHNIVNFDFFDLTAIIHKKWIIRFCEIILERNIQITWQIPAGTRSEAITEQVTSLLYKSGCRNITYAPESGSPEILKAIKKRVILRNMLRSMSSANGEGMNIKINMIMGFPEEKHKNIWETLRFLVQCSWIGVHDMAPSIFQPYPGSALFQKLKEEGKINMDDDAYFYELIYVDSFFYNKFYNEHIHSTWLKFYQLSAYLIFYGTNFLFRPMRLVKTIRNIYTKKYESRSEMALGDLIKRTKFKSREKNDIQLSNSSLI